MKNFPGPVPEPENFLDIKKETAFYCTYKNHRVQSMTENVDNKNGYYKATQYSAGQNSLLDVAHKDHLEEETLAAFFFEV